MDALNLLFAGMAALTGSVSVALLLYLRFWLLELVKSLRATIELLEAMIAHGDGPAG